ncbi:hsp90 co-chaperone Cdc37 [Chytriomyces hyalinus]|nr:hsp90 co-chaperone Cdc37 [Chytriomyces hyalinus]
MSGGFSYSKWDKLELSDDEDFECHPNVDKASMVRWKQAEVHRKRRERSDKIKALQMETQMNNKIVEAFSKLDVQKGLNWPEMATSFTKWDSELAHDVMVMAHSDRDARWQPPVADPFFMKRVDIPKMCKRIDDALKAINGSVIAVLEEYKKTLAARNESIVKEIKTEQAAIDSVISSETVKEGFSKSIITKSAPVTEPPAPEKKKKATKTVKETEIITLNDPQPTDASLAASSAEPTPAQPAATFAPEEAEEEDEVYITDPNVDTFSKLTNTEASYKMISQHPWILGEKYSDQILAEAFNAGMRGDFKRCKECVHQSLLLQYCRLLGKDGVRLFFQRLATPGHKGQDAFMKDVLDTYKRISERVKVLKQQEKEQEDKEKREGEERAAAALQEDGTYKLPITEESTEEDIKQAEVFSQLPTTLQRALLTQDIDEINGFLSSSSKEDTEKYIQLATSVGLISLQADDDE